MNKVRFVVLLSLLWSPGMVCCQAGISLGYVAANAPGWTVRDPNNGAAYPIPGTAIPLALQFELNHPAYRLSLVPELGAMGFQNTIPGQVKISLQMIRLQLNLHLYFLDWRGDCNCPTFSRRGSPLKKGLFLNVSPGLAYLYRNLKGTNPADDFSLAGNMGLGIGYDIGISRQLTLVPYATGYFFPNLAWPQLQNTLTLPAYGSLLVSGTSHLTLLQAGITLRYHL